MGEKVGNTGCIRPPRPGVDITSERHWGKVEPQLLAPWSDAEFFDAGSQARRRFRELSSVGPSFLTAPDAPSPTRTQEGVRGFHCPSFTSPTRSFILTILPPFCACPSRPSHLRPMHVSHLLNLEERVSIPFPLLRPRRTRSSRRTRGARTRVALLRPKRRLDALAHAGEGRRG